MRSLARGEPVAVRNPHATRPWQHVLEPLGGYLLLAARLHEALAAAHASTGNPEPQLGKNAMISPPDRPTSQPPAPPKPSNLQTRATGATQTSSRPLTALQPHSLSLLSSGFNFGPALPSNQPVCGLVEEILRHWPGSWSEQADPGAPHEARLLSLAVDKAFHLLGWRPAWNFAETVRHTVEWYRAVHGGADPRTLTAEQIRLYGRASSG
jgi:CDP-glucose 4,6-dehydratase